MYYDPPAAIYFNFLILKFWSSAIFEFDFDFRFALLIVNTIINLHLIFKITKSTNTFAYSSQIQLSPFIQNQPEEN